MSKLKKFVSSLLIVSMTIVPHVTAANAAVPTATIQSSTQMKTIRRLDTAAQKVETAILSNTAPATADLMKVVKSADSTKIALGDIDQEVVDLFEEKIQSDSITILTEAPDSTEVSKKFTLSAYQLSDGENLMSPNEVLRVARARPLSYTYSNTSYGVQGTISLNCVRGSSSTEITITSVTATPRSTGNVYTTQLDVIAAYAADFGYDDKDYYHKHITENNPVSGRSYTLYTNYVANDVYGNTAIISDSLQAAANFYLSNGHSFSLEVTVTDFDTRPYDPLTNYDNPTPLDGGYTN